MKKKFKSLLALVLVVILAFSSLGLSTFAATVYEVIGYVEDYQTPGGGPGSGGYDISSADLVIFKKGSTDAHIWVRSSVTLTETEIEAIVRSADASIRSYTDAHIILHYDDFASAAPGTPGAYYVDIKSSSTRACVYWDSVSHMMLINLTDIPTGSLTINKYISRTSEKDPVEGDYQVQVVFTGTNLDLINDGDLVGVPGTGTMTYTFFLGKDASFQFTNIPKDTTYAVSEINVAGGWDNYDSSGTTGKIGRDRVWNFSCELKNRYTTPTGELKLTKDVTNGRGTDGDYLINVVFTGTNGNLGQITDDKTSISGTLSTDGNTLTYSFFREDGRDITFSNIPLGVTYNITETINNADCLNTDTLPLSGTIDLTNLDIDLTLHNEYRKDTDFVIKKVVVDTDEIAVSGDYLINVTFTSDYDISDITCDAEGAVKDPASTAHSVTFSFFLEDGEKATFQNVPESAEYLVTETNFAAGWKLVSIVPSSGTVDGSGTTSSTIMTLMCTPVITPDVVVTNTYDDTGSLAITKDITNEDEYPRPYSSDYTISVVFSGAGLDQIEYAGTEISDVLDTEADPATRTITFFLADGDTYNFTNIPALTTYVITEAITNPSWHTTLSANGIAGDIAIGDTDTATITNSYHTSTLTVSKSVIGNPNLGEGERFEFSVTLPMAQYELARTALLTVEMYGYTYTTNVTDPGLLGLASSIGDGTVTFTFSLLNGEWIRFGNIMPGAAYEVEETDNQGALSTSASGDPVDGNFSREQTENKAVTFINSYESNYYPSYYNLTVTKALAGDAAVDADQFSFDVTISNFSGVSYSINGAAPIAVTAALTTIALGDGDTAIFRNILEGTPFSVTETNPGTYTVSATASAGVTVNGAAASGSMSTNQYVSYTNTKNTTTPPTESGVLSEEDESGVLAEEDVLPQTGGITGSTGLAIFGVLLLGAGAILGLRKKREDRD